MALQPWNHSGEWFTGQRGNLDRELPSLGPLPSQREAAMVPERGGLQGDGAESPGSGAERRSGGLEQSTRGRGDGCGHCACASSLRPAQPS